MLERLFVKLFVKLGIGLIMYLCLCAIQEWKENRAKAKEKERLHQEYIEEYAEKIKKLRQENQKLAADNKERRKALERRLSRTKYIDTQQLEHSWKNTKFYVAAESSGGYIDDITTVDIKRSGKLIFTVHVHPISDKDFNTARLLATNDGELDAVLLKSGIIYLATTKEDRKKIWDNIEIRQHFTHKEEEPLSPVEAIDRLLTVGEKVKLTEVIMKISGMSEDEDEPQDEPEPEPEEEKEEKLEPCPICHSEVKAKIERGPGLCKLTIVCEKCGLRFENSQEFHEYMTVGGECHYIPTTLHPVVIWNGRAKKEGNHES